MKAKACKSNTCGREFIPQKPLQVTCGWQCGLDYGRQKVQAKQAKAQRADRRKRKDALKTKGEWAKDAQTSFNRFIRMRDYGEPCISCGASAADVEAAQGWKTGGAWDCGHFLGVGAFPELRWCTWNAHRQCKGCNSGSHYHAKKKRTVSQDYRERLIKKIGQGRVEWLEGPHGPLRPSVEYMKRVKRIFNKRARLYRKFRGL